VEEFFSDLLDQQPKENNDAMQRILTNSAIFLTVITAVLYFHGRNLYGGYLSYWGLGSELFPIPTEDALMHGINTYVWVGVEGWRYLTGVVLYIVALYMVVFLLCHKRPMALIRKAVKTTVINGNQKIVLGVLMNFVERTFLVLLVVLLFILLTGFAQKKGHRVAEDRHKKMMAGQPLSQNKFEKVSIVCQGEAGRNETVSGYRLAASSTLCALYTEDGVRVLPLSKIASMRISERVEKGAGE
jgi:hypothetical protein